MYVLFIQLFRYNIWCIIKSEICRKESVSMYELSINNVVPNMVLYHDIYCKNANYMLPSLTVLTQEHIAMLKSHGIFQVTLADLTEVNESRYKILRSSQAFNDFSILYKQKLQHFIRLVNNLGTGLDLQAESLLQIRDDIVSSLCCGEQLLDFLYYMVPDEHEITYTHCFNCGLIAYYFAKWCGFFPEDCDTATICGFLFDIGKTKIQDQLIWKQDKLTPEEFVLMQHHIHLGYELLRNKTLPPHVISTLIMHHERCDGSGYPAHLKENRIDPFALFIGIVDTYEALTHPRAQRLAYTPFQAIEAFEEEGFYKYGEKNTRIIMEKIAESNCGRRIELSDGTLGTVKEIHKDMLCKPTIQTDHYLIDLRNQPKLSITRMS